MSLNFSAQQYDAAFKPKRLGNWEVPKTFPQLPRYRSRLSDTQFVANELGHLRPELKCKRRNPFCNYIGTYQLPRRITKEFAQKLSRFPHDYSVLNDINDSQYTHCRIRKKCISHRDEIEQEQRFRNVVRDCVRENADENILERDAQQYDIKNSREDANFIDMKNQYLESCDLKQQESEDHTKTLKGKIYEEIENANKNTKVHDVKDYIKQKEDLEKEALGEHMKDEIMRSLKEKDTIDNVNDDKVHKNKQNKESDRTERNSDLRKTVQKCIEENKRDAKDVVNSKDFKDKVKDCVKMSLKDKETNKEHILREQVQRCLDEMKRDEQQDLTEKTMKQNFKERVKTCVDRENEDCIKNGKDAMREGVKECIQKHKSDKEALNKDGFKDKIKRCVKEKERRDENVRNAMRDTVKECMNEHKPDKNTLNKNDFRDKIKRCVKETERRDENIKDTMRDTVKECMKEHKSETKCLNKDEFKDKIKRCVEENYRKENLFRQAVRESIPKNSNNRGKGDSENKCAVKNMQEKGSKNDPETLRKAVRECIKDKAESKADKPAADFKKVVKDCAHQKLKD